MRRVLPWALVLALLAAQTLGLVHRVAHPFTQPFAHPRAHTAVAHAGHGHASDHAQHGLIETLFQGHAGDADCRLYDQLAHSDTLACPPALALPLLLPATLLAYFQGEALARHAALFQARAPPPVR